MIEVCHEGCRQAATAWLARYRGQKPTFACVLSFTETGLLPGISAAGQTPEDRRRTAAADGDFLQEALLQRASHNASTTLPRLPAGVSPAVITRAILQSLAIPCHIFSTGLPIALSTPHIALPQVKAQSLQTGSAMSVPQANQLFEAGLRWGHKLANPGSYLIIGECVVCGTTTAQAVLTALGYDAAGRMSSSHLSGNHQQKRQLVEAGLTAWNRKAGNRKAGNLHSTERSPIEIVAAVGDPMQLVVAGMAIAASQTGGVLLAGGAQMLAVYALSKALGRQQEWNCQQVVVGTTRWVIEDSSADTVAIAAQVGAPYLASQLSFRQSAYMQLRAYERGFVKEGVGAGGCAIAAHLHAGWNNDQLRHAVEKIAKLAY
ncbi:MAG: nicotinate mononucleotide-dependent phosphoribosyltransferase CobT [Cyanobacteria bacterium J06573_11]